MKTGFVKLALPAIAILLAVGLAFATEEEPMLQVAHYYHPIEGWQTTMVDENCINGNQIPCTQDGYQLYEEPSFSSRELRKD
ncbi:MAG: hypothetical protein CMH46_07605 [Muricauda sp.]|nr:DUF6520 family protein [Allomuricauda sp.]MAU15389.1 hypothetical protein [Allomuricauda sp.]|tara:strand:+ start:3078 stop:3323 length:246 start_codon:yes stop_codon:yes gene_type:complete